MPTQEFNVKKILAESSNLPTMPGVATQLLAIKEWEEVDVSEITRIVEKDVALASKILRVVNSAHYGMPREISSIS